MNSLTTSVPAEIIAFLEEYHAFSISVSADNQPWSATCYYAFDREHMRLVFVSDEQTKHASVMRVNNIVSGTVSNDEKNIFKIQGVQFTGSVFMAESDYTRTARRLFLAKFPFAVFRKLTLWFVELEYVKMTDNTHVFATKTHWKRNT